MKDYKEMTESVLQQAKTRAVQQAHQRRLATGLIAASLCLAVLIAVGFGVGRNPADTTQPTISLEKPTTVPATQPTEPEPTETEATEPKEEIVVTTGNVFFLSATEEGAKLDPVQANLMRAVEHRIYVRSLKGMTAHEKYLALLDEISFQEDLKDKYRELLGEWSSYGHRSDDAIITVFSGGFSSILVLDNSQIESVTKETTGVLNVTGSYCVHHNDHTFGKGEYEVTIPGGSRRILLCFSLGHEIEKLLEENPETPLSTISDTVTITIHYKNGTR